MPTRPLKEGHGWILQRPPFTFARWYGQRTEGDPSTNPPNRPRMLINARPTDGGFVDRPGFTKADAAVFGTATSCVTGIFELPGDGDSTLGLKLWTINNGCPGESTGTGYSVCSIDPEQSPQFSRVRWYQAPAPTLVRMGKMGEDIYVSTDGTLNLLQLIRTTPGSEPLGTAGQGHERVLASVSAGNIRAMPGFDFDGKLFMAVDNGAGASYVATWDRKTLRENDLTGINAAHCWAMYHEPLAGGALGRDAIFLGFTGTNQIRFRPAGDTPGTWTTVVPGAGTVSAREMKAFKGKLYIANGDENVFVYDAATNVLSSIGIGTTGIAAGSATQTLDVDNGALYVGYVTTTPDVRIAKFDGTTWTATHKNLTTQFTTIVSIQRMRFYRSALIVLASLAGGESRIHIVQANDIASTNWRQIAMAGAVVGSVIDVMVA